MSGCKAHKFSSQANGLVSVTEYRKMNPFYQFPEEQCCFVTYLLIQNSLQSFPFQLWAIKCALSTTITDPNSTVKQRKSENNT